MALLAAGRQHDADSLLPDLLLSINAIACSLRTTGWTLEIKAQPGI